ncbi:MAG: tyrosine-type recombinase/integrase [Patescibacteria group bacterium]|nr:tyrosine-type recombinase/integrase [Patescibacteria group bacterium]
MILLQWLAGMRTQEVLLMRSCDIDRSGAVWLYRPHQHKNLWRGQERVVHLGPTAQRILRRYLSRSGYLFSPRDAMRGRPGGSRAKLRERYDNMTYARAVARACAKAAVPPFPPYSLRHACATRVAAAESPEREVHPVCQGRFTSSARGATGSGGFRSR